MLILNILQSAPTAAPAGTCEDRTGEWALVDGGRVQNWCTWAAAGDDPLVRCRKKDLYADCPVTCDRCPTPGPVPTGSTSNPVPAPRLEITFVGNPCGDAFPDGKCTECTGDCDTDSDCAGDLRCAQRRGTSGDNNVPGCAWGPDSDAIRFGTDDFCKFYFFVCFFVIFCETILSSRLCISISSLFTHSLIHSFSKNLCCNIYIYKYI